MKRKSLYQLLNKLQRNQSLDNFTARRPYLARSSKVFVLFLAGIEYGTHCEHLPQVINCHRSYLLVWLIQSNDVKRGWTLGKNTTYLRDAKVPFWKQNILR